jgi:hypothetical protein
LEKIANGEQASSWGTTTNENLDFIDDALYGNASVTLSSTTHTLDMQDGTTCSARNAYLTFAGSPGGNVAVSLTPNTYQRVFTVKNNTAYTLTFSQGSGASLAVLAGSAALVVADGAGAGAAVVGGTISPLLELVTFKTSTEPAMDGVGRIFRDSGGMRYDGLTHQFDVGSGASRVTGLEISATGDVTSVGSSKATSFKVGNNVISYAATIPTSSGTQGDIRFNSAVTAGGTLGWVCTGGTTWKIFGIVAA